MDPLFAGRAFGLGGLYSNSLLRRILYPLLRSLSVFGACLPASAEPLKRVRSPYRRFLRLYVFALYILLLRFVKAICGRL
jgi:hypothetical protein